MGKVAPRQREPRYGYHVDGVREPPTIEERVHWKQLEINRFEQLAVRYPADNELYRLAAERVRGEILDIQHAGVRRRRK